MLIPFPIKIVKPVEWSQSELFPLDITISTAVSTTITIIITTTTTTTDLLVSCPVSVKSSWPNNYLNELDTISEHGVNTLGEKLPHRSTHSDWWIQLEFKHNTRQCVNKWRNADCGLIINVCMCTYVRTPTLHYQE